MCRLLCTLFTFLISILPREIDAQIWVVRYDGPDGGDDAAASIAIDDSGNIYVTGESYSSSTGYDYATVKYSSSGIEQWVARYDGPVNGHDGATSIVIDNAGSIYVTGKSYSSGTGFDYATVKYNSSGIEQWVARYDGPDGGDDAATSIAIDNSGNIYVAGASYCSSTDDDYATVKYSSSGIEQWVARYDGPVNGHDGATSIVIDNAGSIYVTGTSLGSGTGSDYATIKYDSLGIEQWIVRYNGPANNQDYTNALAVDSTNNIYVTGGSVGVYTSYDWATVKYNSSGIEQWVKRYDGPSNGLDVARAIAIDNSGYICVTGMSNGGGTYYDFLTIKYNTNGIAQWSARFDTTGGAIEEEAYAIAIDNENNIYVTGYGYDQGPCYCTLKYDSLGMQQWVKYYNGPGNSWDHPWGVAVDNSGNSYVTGESMGLGFQYDYATIKYAPLGIHENAVCSINPKEGYLHVYPNPSSHQSRIKWYVPDYSEEQLVLKIFNSAGMLVKELPNQPSRFDDNVSVLWSGDDNCGHEISTGIYFLRLETNDFNITEKLLLIR